MRSFFSLLAENAVPPGTAAAQIPFLGEEALELMKRYNAMAMMGGLVEDSHTGSAVRSFGAPMQRIEGTQRSRSTIQLFTVHMMGTCRMGSRPERSVVNLDVELRDLPGCYVADASLFPTAVGVNPQVTIMALATRVAQRLRAPN